MRGVWWAGVHGLALAGVLGCGLPLAWRLALGAALLAHARLRPPKPPPLLLVTGRGRWSIPAAGLFELGFDARSAYTSHWVRLVLCDGARPVRLGLLRPEFSASDWRRIQLAVREAGPATRQRRRKRVT